MFLETLTSFIDGHTALIVCVVLGGAMFTVLTGRRYRKLRDARDFWNARAAAVMTACGAGALSAVIFALALGYGNPWMGVVAANYVGVTLWYVREFTGLPDNDGRGGAS